MIIKVSKNLNKQEIWANGVELASVMGMDRKNGKRVFTYRPEEKKYVCAFQNPVLMTDNYRIAKMNPTDRDTLFSLYGNKPRIVEYDGVSVFWDDSHINVWCPSVDTILFAKAMGKILARDDDFKTAAEIGCGSGFLSKYFLAKNRKAKSIIINDISPYAIKCAKDNIKDKRARFEIGEGLDKIRGKKLDLIISNPPYIPRPGSIDDNPYEGVGLLNHLIHEGQKYLNEGGSIMTNVSSLSWDIVFSKKPQMRMKILEKMSVPLKINNVLNNKKWLDFLVKKGLKKKYHQGYEYWQEINIIMFKN